MVLLGPAAFGRLCVETDGRKAALPSPTRQPPSGGCVLKRHHGHTVILMTQPAAFGRLCVETDDKPDKRPDDKPSRLRAAVC